MNVLESLPTNWTRALWISIVAGVAGYLAVSVWTGWNDVTSSISRIGWGGLLLALGLSLTNYALRFLRWSLYLRHLGHRIGVRRNLIVYVAGFALTTTPGKAGEVVRSILLRRDGVPYGHSVGALLSERLTDVLAAIFLALLGGSVVAEWRGFLLAAAGALVLVLVLVRWRADALYELLGRAASEKSWVGRLRRAAGGLRHISDLLDARIFVAGLVAGLLAWMAEGAALYLVLRLLGVDVAFLPAIAVFAVAMLVGAASFLPGGLGSAEAAMVALLVLLGASAAAAATATIFIRLTTLWFGVLLGLIAMGALHRESR